MPNSESLANKSICFVNTTKTWGGGEKWHLENALWFAQKAGKVTVCTNNKSILADKLKENQAIDVFSFRIKSLSFLNIVKVIRIKNFLKKINPDIVVLNLPSDAKAFGLAAKLAGIKTIVYRRGSAIPIKNSFINRYLFRNIITNVLANSHETKSTILKNNPDLIAESDIEVIYNGIDTTLFSPVAKTGKTKPKFIIGNAGRLDKQKAQHYLIDLALILKTKGLDFEIQIAGTGKLENELKELTKLKQVDDLVIFKGFVNDIPKFLNSLDIFILTSLWEGFGYVLAEAAACEVPAIAFNISSNPELIEDGKSGYLIDDYNILEMADKIIFLADNPDVLISMSKYARERAIALFDKNVCFGITGQYFGKIIVGC